MAPKGASGPVRLTRQFLSEQRSRHADSGRDRSLSSLPPGKRLGTVFSTMKGARLPKLTRSALTQQATAASVASSASVTVPERGLTPAESRKLLAQRELRVPLESVSLLPGRVPLKPWETRPSVAASRGLSSWMKQVRAKRERARRRQVAFVDRLRSSIGEPGVLATISMGKSEKDYVKRVNMLWAYMARWNLARSPIGALDAALSDYADHAYLHGETSEHGDKLKAALSAVCPNLMPPGPNLFPLFNRALKGWRRASPTFSRTGHPEAVSYAICGVLFLRGLPAMALFNAALLSTYIRPSGLMNLALGDLVDPPPVEAQLGRHHVLLLAPQERGERAKTNTFDETVILDDVRHPELGQQLKQLKEFRLAEHPELDETELEMLPLWPFRTRDLLPEWKAAVAELELDNLIKTPYEERHSGASRDILLSLRTRDDVQRRGHWKSPSSLRNYEKAGRMAKLAQQVGAHVMASGERIRRDFDSLFQSGIAKGQLGAVRRSGAASTGMCHL